VFNSGVLTFPRQCVATVVASLAAALSVASPAAALARGEVVYAGQRASGPLDSATVQACTTGTDPTQRSVTFSAAMQAVPGTITMSVSFNLYERTSPSGGYAAVNAPAFGVWQTSNRGTASFTANDNVVNLPAPASFRALVHYRWTGRRGRFIRHDDRVTAACVETVPEPDLSIVRITHAPGTPAKTSESYGVVIRNSGPGAAGAFEVAFSIAGAPLADQQVLALAPATTTTVQFSGPRCTPGSTITAQIDPAGAIVEPANPSRTVTLTCPSPTGAAASGAAAGTPATS